MFSERKPLKIRSDGGSEFVNNNVKKVLDSVGIEHFITKNETKANYVERVIRTIKDKMGKYMESKQTHKWEDVLDKMTRSYNHTPHSTIGMRPVNVNTSNQVELWNKLFARAGKSKIKKETPPKTRKIRYKFKIGDKVRISNFKKVFDKTSFSHRWTTEIFFIRKRYIKQGMPIYELDDYIHDNVEGSFYQNELQKVRENPHKQYPIEKIITKRKTKQGETEYFVKFKGWPKKYNTWVKNLEPIQNE